MNGFNEIHDGTRNADMKTEADGSKEGGVTVLWDLVDCPISEDLELDGLLDKIRTFFSRESFEGPVEVSAFCCLADFSPDLRNQITSSTITVHDIPPESHPAVRSKALLLLLFLWIIENSKSTATVCIISSTRDPSLSTAVHAMNSKNFNVIFIYPSHSEPPPPMGCAVLPWDYLCDVKPKIPKEDLPLPLKTAYPDNVRDSVVSREVEPGLLNKEKKFLLRVMASLEKDRLPPTRELLIARIDELSEDACEGPALDSSMMERGVNSGDLEEMEKKGRILLLPAGMQKCWNFVDVRSSGATYEDQVWDAVEVYLQSPRGRMRTEMTDSSYEAAKAFKAYGPTELCQLSLGELLHIAQLVVREKKWIMTNPNGWNPVRVLVRKEPEQWRGGGVGRAQRGRGVGYGGGGDHLPKREELYSVTEWEKGGHREREKVQMSLFEHTEWGQSNAGTSATRRVENLVVSRNGHADTPVDDNFFFPFEERVAAGKAGPLVGKAGPSVQRLPEASAEEMRNATAVNEFSRWLAVKLWRLSLKNCTMDIAQLKLEFQKDCGKELAYKAWGYGKMTTLLSFLPDVVVLDKDGPSAIKLYPATPLIQDLAVTISQLLGEKGAFDMGRLKALFMEKNGYPLEHQSLGFPTLKSLVLCIPEVCRIAIVGNEGAKIVHPSYVDAIL